jgi:SagB-type dehydrogenase family enzyme
MQEIPFSQLYHQNTKLINRIIPWDDSFWPDEWKTTYYKKYFRLPKIELENEKINFDLFEAIEKRSSKREMNGGKISKKELSIFLKYSCGNTLKRKDNPSKWHRAQPSGGARFPVEVYGLLTKPGEGLKPGLFHYNVQDHELEMIWEKEFSESDLERMASYEFFSKSSLVIFMTAVFWRSQNKYGERGYRFILQESGHIGQNMYLVSEALGLKCCSLGGFRISDEQIEQVLDIDGATESIIYTIVIGK